jgi:hypothetical protein
MFTKTLLAAAALSFMALAATSPAHATYGNGHHNKHHYNFSYNAYPWFNTYSYKAYAYQPSCSYEPQLVRIKVWTGYGNYYFKSVWRDVRVCH